MISSYLKDGLQTLEIHNHLQNLVIHHSYCRENNFKVEELVDEYCSPAKLPTQKC